MFTTCMLQLCDVLLAMLFIDFRIVGSPLRYTAVTERDLQADKIVQQYTEYLMLG